MEILRFYTLLYGFVGKAIFYCSSESPDLSFSCDEIHRFDKTSLGNRVLSLEHRRIFWGLTNKYLVGKGKNEHFLTATVQSATS